jgi:hypothetical protein
MEDTFITPTQFLDQYPVEIIDSRIEFVDRQGTQSMTLTLSYEGRTIEQSWTQGAAWNGEPSVEQLLESVSMDSRILVNCRDGLDLMDEFGYESTGEARSTWDSLVRQREQWTTLLGDEGYALLTTVDEDIDN